MATKRKEVDDDEQTKPREELLDDEIEDEPEAEEEDEVASATDDGSDEDDDGDEDEDEDEDEEDADIDVTVDLVDVNFEFFDPQEKDFHGIKALLANFLAGERYHSSELTDFILNQNYVGTVVKAGEDEGPLGVCSIVNTSKHRDLAFAKDIYKFLTKHCTTEDTLHKLEKAWNSHGTGLIVNARLLNCPPQLGPPLQTNLFKEIHNALTDRDSTPEERDTFTFKRFIVYDRVYCPAPSAHLPEGEPSTSQQSKKKHKKAHKTPLPAGSVVYVLPESELYHKHCQWSYMFPEGGGGSEELLPHRLVCCITADKAKVARSELDGIFGNAMLQQQGDA